MTTCPTCGTECTIVSDKEGTNYYQPVFYRNTTLDELRALLACCPGETVLEAAKRWRQTVESIAKPLAYFQEYAKKEGRVIDGPMALSIIDSPAWYKERARELLGD